MVEQNLYATCEHISIAYILVPLLQATPQSIVTLESQMIRLNCIPSPSNLVVTWMFNGAGIPGQQRITFTPAQRNHTLIISDAETSDSGEYRCELVGNFAMPLSRIITLDVLESMYVEYLVHCDIYKFSN